MFYCEIIVAISNCKKYHRKIPCIFTQFPPNGNILQNCSKISLWDQHIATVRCSLSVVHLYSHSSPLAEDTDLERSSPHPSFNPWPLLTCLQFSYFWQVMKSYNIAPVIGFLHSTRFLATPSRIGCVSSVVSLLASGLWLSCTDSD